MLNENAFTETLRAVKEIVRTAPQPLSDEEILEYFKDMELSEAHKQMVLLYFANPEEETAHQEENTTEAKEETAVEEEAVSTDSKVFQMYLDEVEKLPHYSEDELRDMYSKLLAGDSSVINNIVNAWVKRIIDISADFELTGYNHEDVIQEGNMGLYEKLLELCGSNADIDVDKALDEAVEAAMIACFSNLTDEVKFGEK